MLYYYLFATLLAMFALERTFDSRSFRKLIFIMSSALIVVIVAFRYESVDYYNYIGIFQSQSFDYLGFPFFDRTSSSTGDEFLFASIVSAYNLILGANDYWLLFAFFSLVSLTLKFGILYKYSLSPILTLIIFLSFPFFKELGQFRMAISAGFYLLSIVFLANGEKIKFLMSSAFAFMFHSFGFFSALIYFSKFFFKNKCRSSISLSVGFLVAVSGLSELVFSFVLTYLPTQMAHNFVSYHYSAFYWGGATLNYLNVSFLLFGVIFIFNLNKIRQDKVIEYCYYSYMLGLVIHFMSFGMSGLPGRVLDFFVFLPACLILPFLVSKSTGITQFLWLSITLIFASAFFVRNVMFSAAPYQFVFS